MKLQSNFNFLLDEPFLINLIEQQEHDIYARITALNNDNDPIDQIQGKITTGSINIDGDSAIRRTCSLTLINEDINFNDFYWGIKTKFKLEIGLYNYLNGQYSSKNGYPEIAWFPQGYYVITTFNSTLSTSSYNISISGKDKMCLLNGELSGSLPASINFGIEETLIDNVELSQINDLETILNGSYYIVSNKTYINKNNFRNQKINDKDSIYIYIQDDDGKFYTEDGIIFQQRKQGKEYSNKYQIYELVKSLKNIDSLFKKAGLKYGEYEKNKYYYKDELKGYILDTNKTQSLGNISDYFSLVDIYQKIIDVTKEKNPIEKIIKEAVHVYAQEPYQNIIINDLDDQGLEKLTFKGESAYVIYERTSDAIYQFILPNQSRSIENCLKDEHWSGYPSFSYYNPLDGKDNATPIFLKDNRFSRIDNGTEGYVVRKIKYGEDVGYRLTPLTYAGDLIANIGETFTSVLDKIKTMLGEFEYFYDLEGRFVFQKKKNYLQTSWNQLSITNDKINQENNYIDFNKNKISYNFINNQLFSNIQNSPTLTNVKNDFTVWGKRKGISGESIPIHARYSIDNKPIVYQTLNQQIFYNYEKQKQPLLNNTGIDRYLIQQNKIGSHWWNFIQFIDFLESIGINIDKNTKVNSLLPLLGASKEEITEYFPKVSYNKNDNDIRFMSIEKTEDPLNSSLVKYQIIPSYEHGYQPIWYYYNQYQTNENKQYYIYIPSIDFIKFVDWREIIYQMALDYFAAQGCSEDKPVYLGKEKGEKKYLTNPDNFLYEVGKKNSAYYPTGYTGYEQYYTDLQGFWRQLYNPFYQTEDYYTKEEDPNRCFWNKNVYDDPGGLNFWFDFLDPEQNDAELMKFSISEIGDRNIVVNEDKASSIIFNEVPDMILYDNDALYKNQKEMFSGQTFIKVPSWYSQYFAISSKSLSVKDKIDELLYQRTYCTENITITSIPIYHLQPNTRILVKDDETGINGEYIIHKITIPLTYNGTMSISASKAPERLY